MATAPIVVRATKQETSHVQEYGDRARRRGRPRDGARLRELCAADPAGMVARLPKFKVGQALRRRQRRRGRERLSVLDAVSQSITLGLITRPFVPAHALSRGRTESDAAPYSSGSVVKNKG